MKTVPNTKKVRPEFVDPEKLGQGFFVPGKLINMETIEFLDGGGFEVLETGPAIILECREPRLEDFEDLLIGPNSSYFGFDKNGNLNGEIGCMIEIYNTKKNKKEIICMYPTGWAAPEIFYVGGGRKDLGIPLVCPNCENPLCFYSEKVWSGIYECFKFCSPE